MSMGNTGALAHGLLAACLPAHPPPLPDTGSQCPSEGPQGWRGTLEGRGLLAGQGKREMVRPLR